MSIWSNLWARRNEPALVLLSLAVVGLVGVAVILMLLQFFFRAAPLICNGIWFPTSPEECSASASRDSMAENFPIGAILPYFGLDEDIPAGWVVCDGRDVPEDSPIRLDANAEKGGRQLPDLRNRFVRGAAAALSEEGVRAGGSDTIDLEHSHLWARKKGGQWFSHRGGSKEWGRVDDWNDGIGDNGEGNRPLSNDGDLELHTDSQGNQSANNLPAYVELRYIVRVR